MRERELDAEYRDLLSIRGDEPEGPEDDFEDTGEEEDADDLLVQQVEDGEICAFCESKFEKEQGSPTLCHTCHKNATLSEQEQYPEANCETV